MQLFTQPINQNNKIARMRASVDSMVVLGAGKTDNTLCKNLMAARFGANDKVYTGPQTMLLKIRQHVLKHYNVYQLFKIFKQEMYFRV